MPEASITVRFDRNEQDYSLDPDVVYGIGRSPQNLICIPSHTVSRNHALIKQDETGQFCLFDLGSRNGTVLNQRLIHSPAQLCDGDVISIGEVTLFFSQANSESSQDDLLASPYTVVSSDVSQTLVLVMDIRGYTPLARRIGESRTAELIRAFNHGAGEILMRSGTWTEKFIGDAVMAVWRVDLRNTTADRALKALGVCNEVGDFAHALPAHIGMEETVSLGAGLASGPASIGNIGSGSTADHTVLGDAVNRAFRLEAATRALACDISVDTGVYSALERVLHLDGLFLKRQVQLKGYSEESEVYTLQRTDLPRVLAAAPLRTVG